MNSRQSHSATFSGRWTSFIGAVVAVALMVPVAAFSASPAPVNLGTAGNFIILAKTGISTTGTTAITGDLGVSPAAATSITGFGLIADATNTFSTSALVTGKLYAANYAAPTPTIMTTAISDMETAYTDAAGRTLPDYTELYTGNVTGKTLTPGLYKWGTSVLINAGGVTISGSPSDVWIFQVAGDLTVGNAAIVTLAGGAQAKNIFWQVAGQVTIGTTAQMKGIILCQTLIDMQNGSTLNGRALAQTAVTSNANAVVMPATATSVITFDALITKRTGNSPFKLTATASSGLPVTYTSSNPLVATVSGDTITIVGAGIDTITASQPGNSNYLAAVAVKRVLTVLSGKPFITSPDTASVAGGASFVYKVTYQIPGNPTVYTDTVLSKPTWVAIQNDSIRGTAPNVNRYDTVRVMIGSGTVSDTLTLVIRITFQESAVNSGLVTDKDIFGVSRGNRLGINAGAYEIMAYDLAGRMIFQQKASAKAGFITMMVPRNTCNVNIIRLTQGNRSIVKKMQVER